CRLGSCHCQASSRAERRPNYCRERVESRKCIPDRTSVAESACWQSGNNLKKTSGFLKCRCGGITCLLKRASNSFALFRACDIKLRPCSGKSGDVRSVNSAATRLAERYHRTRQREVGSNPGAVRAEQTKRVAPVR